MPSFAFFSLSINTWWFLGELDLSSNFQCGCYHPNLKLTLHVSPKAAAGSLTLIPMTLLPTPLSFSSSFSHLSSASSLSRLPYVVASVQSSRKILNPNLTLRSLVQKLSRYLSTPLDWTWQALKQSASFACLTSRKVTTSACWIDANMDSMFTASSSGFPPTLPVPLAVQTSPPHQQELLSQMTSWFCQLLISFLFYFNLVPLSCFPKLVYLLPFVVLYSMKS